MVKHVKCPWDGPDARILTRYGANVPRPQLGSQLLIQSAPVPTATWVVQLDQCRWPKLPRPVPSKPPKSALPSPVYATTLGRTENGCVVLSCVSRPGRRDAKHADGSTNPESPQATIAPRATRLCLSRREAIFVSDTPLPCLRSGTSPRALGPLRRSERRLCTIYCNRRGPRHLPRSLSTDLRSDGGASRASPTNQMPQCWPTRCEGLPSIYAYGMVPRGYRRTRRGLRVGVCADDTMPMRTFVAHEPRFSTALAQLGILTPKSQ